MYYSKPSTGTQKHMFSKYVGTWVDVDYVESTYVNHTVSIYT
jgi:hypothetical protein